MAPAHAPGGTVALVGGGPFIEMNDVFPTLSK